MVYLTRLEHFNAAHKLYNPAWNREKNEEVFGKCANENWHGHNYELLVTVKGDPDPDTGFLFDVKKLSNIIKEAVTDKLDHKNLNVDVDFMRGKNVFDRESGNSHMETVGTPHSVTGKTTLRKAIRNAKDLY